MKLLVFLSISFFIAIPFVIQYDLKTTAIAKVKKESQEMVGSKCFDFVVGISDCNLKMKCVVKLNSGKTKIMKTPVYNEIVPCEE